MTKKDYKLIAQAISASKQESCGRPTWEAAMDDIMEKLCQSLLADNPAFNGEKFKEACK